ncbi:MAG TPA: thioredoxin domain-containing protein, partial [Rhizomicrobium sp.]
IVIVGALLLASAGYYYLAMNGNGDNEASDAPGFVITKTDRTMGNPKAPVTLIEYAAPVCPHCANFDMNSFPLLKAGYIDTGKVFYVFRVFPIRPEDGPAEKMARCLPADKYFSFIDLLFRNQAKWDVSEYPKTATRDGLVTMGRIAGMSEDQIDKCIDNKAEDERINAVAKDGVDKYNINGTPTFVVNGVAQPAGEEWPDLQSSLDSALAHK